MAARKTTAKQPTPTEQVAAETDDLNTDDALDAAAGPEADRRKPMPARTPPPEPAPVASITDLNRQVAKQIMARRADGKPLHSDFEDLDDFDQQAPLGNAPLSRGQAGLDPDDADPSSDQDDGFRDRPRPISNRPTRRNVDPIVSQGMEIVQASRRAEQREQHAALAERRARRARRQQRESGTTTKPIRLRRRGSKQWGVVRDSQGDRVQIPGRRIRTVRCVDAEGRPSEARVSEFIEDGYEPVIDKHTGEPVTVDRGIAVSYTAEAYANRVFNHEVPGASDPDDLLDDVYTARDELNARAGEFVADVRPMREHGHTRVIG
jgi:hypothetical protein